ncbi:MAG TPA: YCF48-related protein [Armatimonadota bacterium]|jgi:photosystem II stability/assembly factor-like uncharacterized protein
MRGLPVIVAIALILAPVSRAEGVMAGDGGWVWQNPAPLNNLLYAVHFVSPRTGWAIGEAGAILRTDDGGATWRSQVSGTNAYLLFAHFLDAAHGWVIGIRSSPGSTVYPVLLATSDGGATWLPQDPMTWDIPFSIRFTDALHGWLVGDHGIVRRTANGGKTWEAVETGIRARLNGVTFADSLHGWIVGGDDLDGPASPNRVSLRTTDGGVTWTGSLSIPGVPLMQAQFLDDARGWATDSAGSLLRSVDGGQTWSPQTTPIGYVGAVQFVDAQHGWANGQSLWRTSDGGSAWEDLTWVTDGSAHDFQFLDALHGFSVHGGQPYRTEDGGLTWQPLFPGADRPSFRAVSFPDARTGWALAGGGVAWRTADAGAHWTPANLSIPTSQHADDIVFTDALNGWVVGGSGMIRHTVDGGATWKPQTSGSLDDLTTVFALDADHAWARGSASFLRTVNGGQSWEPLPTGGRFHFVSPTIGFRVSRNVVQRSDDGGLHWGDVAVLDAGFTLGRIHFLDADNGLLGGYYRASADATRQSAVLRTTDGGKTWTPRAIGSEPSEVVTSVRLLGPSDEWAMASGHEYHSTDAGKTWSRRWMGSSWSLLDVDFTDPLNGWAVGSEGTILHTRTGGALPGDVNGDGVVNAMDARLALAAAGGLTGDPGGAARADVDGDGRVTLADAAGILRRLSLPRGVVEGVVAANDYLASPCGTHVVRAPSGSVTALLSASVDLRRFEGQKVDLSGVWLPGYPTSNQGGPRMLDVQSSQVVP